MKKSKKSKKKAQVSTHWSNLAIAGMLIAIILFATGIVVWNYLPIKSVDIFVVHPLVATPVPTPFIPTEVVPVDQIPEQTADPVLEEAIPTDSPSNYNDETVADPYATTPGEAEITSTTPPAKPGFLEQSVLGWTIIMKAITAPFTK